MAKRLTIECCHKIAKERNGSCLSVKYVNSITKYEWRCKYGHVWNARYSDVARNGWCPECAGKQKKTIEDCHHLAMTHHGKCLDSEYINNKVKMKWRCNEGHVFMSSYGHVRRGIWCPECAGNKKRTITDLHNLARPRGGICLSLSYVNANAKYRWRCKNGHTWRARYCNVRRGTWCVECVGLSRKTIGDCHRLANEKNGDFLSEEYVNSSTKYKWKCESGHVFEAKYNAVQQDHWCFKCFPERARKTSLKNYGVEYPQQNKEVALRAAKSMNNSYTLSHWKTGEELVCIGSYEVRVVEYFNEKRINFRWQPEVFKTAIKTPTDRFSTYTPDCYLPDQDLWIEIKGYFRKDAKEKWDWFHKEYPNSELWDKKKLKEMKIL